MRCVSCNKNLTDREASRKFTGWENISNPEERYINLCDRCFTDADMNGVENPFASDEEYQDEIEVQEDKDEN